MRHIVHFADVTDTTGSADAIACDEAFNQLDIASERRGWYR